MQAAACRADRGRRPAPTATSIRSKRDADDDDDEHDEGPLELARDIAGKTAKAALDRIEELGEDLGAYLDNARWQLPRLARLLQPHLDDTRISLGRSLADQAAKIGERTFFFVARPRVQLRRCESPGRCGRARARRVRRQAWDARRRDHESRGHRTHLSAVTAINRIGAVAVLISPEADAQLISRALELGEAELRDRVDPDNATLVRAATPIKLLLRSAASASEQGEHLPDGMQRAPRAIPAGVIDMESIDPKAVTLPAWYRADAGRA